MGYILYDSSARRVCILGMMKYTCVRALITFFRYVHALFCIRASDLHLDLQYEAFEETCSSCNTIEIITTTYSMPLK